MQGFYAAFPLVARNDTKVMVKQSYNLPCHGTNLTLQFVMWICFLWLVNMQPLANLLQFSIWLVRRSLEAAFGRKTDLIKKSRSLCSVFIRAAECA